MRFFLVLMLVLAGCDLLRERPLPLCDNPGVRLQLRLVESAPNVSCVAPTGKLVAEPVTGTPPFRYALDGGPLQASPEFNNLFGGDHLIHMVDANNCEGALVASVTTAATAMTARIFTTPDNQCFSDAGTIAIAPTGGQGPYRYQRDSLVAQADSVLYGVKKGYHWVKVIDAQGCEYQRVVEVEHGFTGISYAREVFPIITKYCTYPGCHNGDVGSNANFLVFNNVRTYGMLMVRYATAAHEVQVPDAEVAYIRCWVEDGRLNN